MMTAMECQIQKTRSPLNSSESIDTDGDGTGNNADSDDDNDGVADSADAFPAKFRRISRC